MFFNNPTTIAVTGHRKLKPGAAAAIIGNLWRLTICHPGARWLAGGAVGADQIAAEELFRLDRRVGLILPFPPHLQAAQWSVGSRSTFIRHVNRAHSIQIIRPTYDVTAYRKRNAALVSQADGLVAFWNGEPGSGTAATVAEARRQGKPVCHVLI